MWRILVFGKTRFTQATTPEYAGRFTVVNLKYQLGPKQCPDNHESLTKMVKNTDYQ